MKSIKDFLTIKQDKNTTIMDVFNEINLQDAASLKLESIYGYWCFNLGDTLEKFQKVVYTKDDTNYVLKLNSDDMIFFIKAFPKDDGIYEIGVSYDNNNVMYYEFFHDKNRSTDLITQLNINKSKCFRSIKNEGIKISDSPKDFYDYSKLFGLVNEFKDLHNKYFDYLMDNHLTLAEKMEPMVK